MSFADPDRFRRPRARFLALALLATALASTAVVAPIWLREHDTPPPPARQADAPPLPVERLAMPHCGPLEYEGEGTPDVLVVASLGLGWRGRVETVHPAFRPTGEGARQTAEAIRFVLDEHGWKVGDLHVAYQACDDSEPLVGKWISGRCSGNATAAAENESVVAVIGPSTSGCATTQIPVLNSAPDGPVVLVSPTNTYVCLTESGPGCAQDEPDKYYPTGRRNYVRLAGHDAYEAAALAEVARSRGLKRCTVLHDREAYGLGVARSFAKAARSLGIAIAGFTGWNPRASTYTALMRHIGDLRPDCLFLGGLVDENGAQVIKDKRAVLGRNRGRVKLLLPSGFATRATIAEADASARGALIGVSGLSLTRVNGEARRFVEALRRRFAGARLDPSVVYAGEAARLVLSAIEAAGADRAKIVAKLFEMGGEGGFIGDYAITKTGDPTVAPVAVYVVREEFESLTVVTPSAELVAAALGRR